MATIRLPMLNWAASPDDSGDVFFSNYANYATNDNWKRAILVFEDTATKISLYGSFDVPQNYVGTANLVVVWTATATAGDVEYDFDYRAVGGNDTESLDQATAQESVNAADTAPSAVNERMELSISLTDGNFTAGDTVLFILSRDGTDVGDTMAAEVLIFDVFFEYADA